MKKNNINNIVIFTIDSVFSTIYLQALLPQIHKNVSLICISERYGDKYGSLSDQVIEHIKDSGIKYSNYMAAIYLYHIPIIFILNLVAKTLRFKHKNMLITQMAKKYNIPLIKINDVNNAEFEKKLSEVKPDIIVSAYFDQIMKEHIFALPNLGTINFHPGYLPDFPGPSATFWAMKNQGNVGSTIHYVDAGIDTGNVILRSSVEKNKAKSVIGMDYEVFSKGAENTLTVLNAIEKNEVSQFSQEKGGNYYSFPKTKDVSDAIKNNLHLIKFWEYMRFFRAPRINET
ncbi:MAG: hypothetical protein KUG80_08675 [Gammaproteobacteria bacterium]|nr:hypothetical protein [Gammaproteobacteria bacterium]